MATDITAVDYLTRSVDRNRYFYGKLMTVRDFLREQEYFNSKRWLINRLLFGSGILCGLEVTAPGGIDAANVVEIQPGVAFDPLGREITVSNRERVDLAKLVTPDLVPGGTADTNLLVCLNYHECPKEPVPSLGGSPCDEVCESNRVGETFTVGLMKAPADAVAPFSCEVWLNRQTVARQTANFDVERIAPVWVRQGEVFEVALKVTARNDVNNVAVNETVAGGALVEPNPLPPPQFPTPPLGLRKGEFFVYVYQVQAPGVVGSVVLSGAGGVPTPPTNVQVLDPTTANARDAEMRLGACPGEPAQTCVPIAKIRASFNGGTLTGITVLDTLNQQRFRYSLTRVAELLDCVRASLRAEADSPRPGHAFITFKDLERADLQPIGPANDHGKSFTVTRGDHVHALLLNTDSGLLFEGNKLRIEGNVGGANVNFLNPVSGQDPVNPQHLTTKHYVDARIAGLDWQESVITRRRFEPPETIEVGDRYLVAPYPSSIPRPPAARPWPKHVGSIATWNGKTWDYAEPDEGTAVFVEDENIAYLFVDGKWIPFLATPEVAAGDGLRADGAIISVGQGPGLKVNPNDVEVVFEANLPTPVGPTPSAGSARTASPGDHTHRLPLTPNGGLTFSRITKSLPDPQKEEESLLAEDDRPDLRVGLHIDGLVGGADIHFLNPVWGQSPTDPQHLVTKQYVDGIAAGLDWQNSVLDKDLFAPPRSPAVGARYLVLHTSDITVTPPKETGGEVESLREKSGTPEESLRETSPTPLPTPFPSPRPFPFPFPFPKSEWTGHENSIATWGGEAWSYTVPNEGMAVFVEDENTAYLFVDQQWVPFMAMPSVAAGKGLRADGASLSVGQGSGLRVNENDVEVIYHASNPAPVGPVTFPGSSPALSHGDHSHELPLVPSGGLEFIRSVKSEPEKGQEFITSGDETDGANAPLRLRINGRVNGDAINFAFPVLGQDPLLPGHLTTKQYVDGLVAGLTWQSTVLDKDLAKPPDEPKKGDRYLLFVSPTAGTPWEGHQGNIATWGVKKWDFTAPTEGMAAFVADENLAYLYADGKWVQFLAPPAPVGAGNGLFQKLSDLNVGQGEGIIVSPDAVSVNFGVNTPTSVGTYGSAGGSRQSAQSDHSHELPLAPSGGLEFVSVSGLPPKGGETESIKPGGEIDGGSTGRPQLRVNGTVSGESIAFQFPVRGQKPTDPSHLATKQYVDAKGVGAVAGDGLIGSGNIISVGGGPGLVVGADEVHVNFEDDTTQPVGQFASPGRANTVARGDHVHAAPDVWGTSVATGVVAFSMKMAGAQPHINSLPVDPNLGGGTITVVLGLESELPNEGTFVGEIDHFEEAMSEGGGFRRFQSILLGAVILPPGTKTTTSTNLKNTRFEIWAQATESARVLPDTFRVRWWAYKVGRDLGTIDYMPPAPSGVETLPDR